MLAIVSAFVLAFYVLPTPWGVVLVLSAIAWEISEKAFWFYRTKDIPVAVGPEAMLGKSVDVIAACKPDGKVRFSGERWNASCLHGADIGETVVVQAIERLTLIVSSTQPEVRQTI